MTPSEVTPDQMAVGQVTSDQMALGKALGAHHLVSLRVENRAGVLARVAGLFSRRGFNIISLAVAPTENERFSRIAIVVDADSAPLQQVVDQLDKLVNVVEITELRPRDAIQAELMLATVLTTGAKRSEVDAVVREHGATLIEEGSGAATLMLAAGSDRLDRLEAALGPIGILALQRTGAIALRKLGEPPA